MQKINKSNVHFCCCKICEVPFATINTIIDTCSKQCKLKQDELKKNTELANQKAQEEDWCLGSNFTIETEKVNIVVSNFSLKKIALGQTLFNYVVCFKNNYIKLTNVLPIKNCYESMEVFNSYTNFNI